MSIDYESIREEHIRAYGTDINRYGPVLLENLYSDRTHFLYELLQNAEDAGATEIEFTLSDIQLEVRHDGRPFNEDDVRGICGLVVSTKAEDASKIGKFGIGFKSVYAYTRTPEIHSGDEHFVVRDYVQPFPLPEHGDRHFETRFVFPFDRHDVTAEDAFREIHARLHDLGVRTLLFLDSLQTIEWHCTDGSHGTYIRSQDGDRLPDAGDITIRQEAVLGESTIENHTSAAEEQWLVFGHSFELSARQVQVEAAFLIDTDEEGLVYVRRANDTELVVYFPTEKETKLGFLIQGPYRTTSTRENILEHDPVNQALVDATSDLVVKALQWLRDEGLLDVRCLQTLPINGREFHNTIFKPLFDAVVEALKALPLLPTEDGRNIPATHAALARTPGLRELLTPDDLSLLLKRNKPVAWLRSDISYDRTRELWRYLREWLWVPEVTADSFAREVDEVFLEQQSDEWMTRFYSFLRSQEALWRKGWSRSTRGPLRDRPFIRLENESHRCPFDEDGRPVVYLPRETDTHFPTVKRTIASDPDAAEFLRSLGLSQPDIVDVVLQYILPRYSGTRGQPGQYYKRDLQMILSALHGLSRNRLNDLISQLRNTPFLWAQNPASGEKALRRPDQLYLRSGELELYFHSNPSAWFLDERVEAFLQRHGIVDKQLDQLGVSRRVRIHYRPANEEGYVYIRRMHGDHARGTNGFDPDATIEGLEHAMRHPTEEKSRFIWNQLLAKHHDLIRGKVEMATRQSYDNREVSEQLSEIGRVATSLAWLPGPDGQFYVPAELFFADLPQGFKVNEQLASQLGMKPDSLRSLAEENGLELEVLQVLRNLKSRDPDAYRELYEGAKRQVGQSVEGESTLVDINYAEEFEKALERPSQQHFAGIVDNEYALAETGGADLGRRRARVAEEIGEARAHEPQPKKRQRLSLRKAWESKNPTVRAFLEEQYRGRCQICGKTFLKRNGEPYFEAIHLVSRRAARWLDHPGNAVSFCAMHAAQWLHGTVEKRDPDMLVQQILSDEESVLRIRLCDRDVDIHFTPKHFAELQAMLQQSDDGTMHTGPGTGRTLA